MTEISFTLVAFDRLLHACYKTSLFSITTQFYCNHFTKGGGEMEAHGGAGSKWEVNTLIKYRKVILSANTVYYFVLSVTSNTQETSTDI